MFNADDIIRGEISLSPADKKLRDDFVREYIRDYNSYAACVRLGFIDELALETAKQLIEDPYVKRMLVNVEENRSSNINKGGDKDLTVLPEDFVPHDEDMDKQRIISALFREAFYKGPGASHASRVSALGKLADIYKLAKEQGPEESANQSVMVVPPVGDVNSWEDQAEAQQTELKRTVKE
ncbi:MAG: hypothetical protein ACN2B6_12575 [Rickettsiales bacterium]